jgi:hypothetical protein
VWVVVESIVERERGNEWLDPKMFVVLLVSFWCATCQQKRNPETSMHHTYTIFADYFQVYLVDEKMPWYHPEMWSETVYLQERVAAAPGVIGISTVRDTDVPVEVEVAESEPLDRVDGRDQVVDCGIAVQSGKLKLGGPGLDDDVPLISILPGTYRARIFFGGLNTLSADGLEGNDRYRIVLWSGKATPVTILKKHTPKTL